VIRDHQIKKLQKTSAACSREMIEPMDLPQNLKETALRTEEDINSLRDTERNLILRVLREVKGNKYRAAKKLGITRSTLYGKLKKHGIIASEKE
jgi:transcriptional regulator of acetoin/glycerol metabolism